MIDSFVGDPYKERLEIRYKISNDDLVLYKKLLRSPKELIINLESLEILNHLDHKFKVKRLILKGKTAEIGKDNGSNFEFLNNLEYFEIELHNKIDRKFANRLLKAIKNSKVKYRVIVSGKLVYFASNFLDAYPIQILNKFHFNYY